MFCFARYLPLALVRHLVGEEHLAPAPKYGQMPLGPPTGHALRIPSFPFSFFGYLGITIKERLT